jgi:hypothetical protein
MRKHPYSPASFFASNGWRKTIHNALCVSLAILYAAPSFAAEGVFLDTDTARRLVGEVYAGRECAGQLELCDSQRANAEEQARILAEGVRAGEKDIASLRAEADALGGHLKDVAGDLAKCEAEKPSWWSGFGWGSAVTAVAAALLAGMAMK